MAVTIAATAGSRRLKPIRVERMKLLIKHPYWSCAELRLPSANGDEDDARKPGARPFPPAATRGYCKDEGIDQKVAKIKGRGKRGRQQRYSSTPSKTLIAIWQPQASPRGIGSCDAEENEEKRNNEYVHLRNAAFR